MKKRYLTILPAVAMASLLALASCGSDSVTVDKEEIKYNEADKLTSSEAYDAAYEALKTKYEKLMEDSYKAPEVTEENPYAVYTASDFEITVATESITKVGQPKATTSNIYTMSTKYDDENRAFYQKGESEEKIESLAETYDDIEKIDSNIQTIDDDWYKLNFLNNSCRSAYIGSYDNYVAMVLDDWNTTDVTLNTFEDAYTESTTTDTNEFFYNATDGKLTLKSTITETVESEKYTSTYLAQLTVTDNSVTFIYTADTTNNDKSVTQYQYANITFEDQTVKTYDKDDFMSNMY